VRMGKLRSEHERALKEKSEVSSKVYPVMNKFDTVL